MVLASNSNIVTPGYSRVMANESTGSEAKGIFRLMILFKTQSELLNSKGQSLKGVDEEALPSGQVEESFALSPVPFPGGSDVVTTFGALEENQGWTL